MFHWPLSTTTSVSRQSRTLFRQPLSSPPRKRNKLCVLGMGTLLMEICTWVFHFQALITKISKKDSMKMLTPLSWTSPEMPKAQCLQSTVSASPESLISVTARARKWLTQWDRSRMRSTLTVLWILTNYCAPRMNEVWIDDASLLIGIDRKSVV